MNRKKSLTFFEINNNMERVLSPSPEDNLLDRMINEEGDSAPI
jgi:hypothetical protein